MIGSPEEPVSELCHIDRNFVPIFRWGALGIQILARAPSIAPFAGCAAGTQPQTGEEAQHHTG